LHHRRNLTAMRRGGAERSAGLISRPSSGRRRLLRPLSALRASPARPSSRPPKPSKTREEARCRVDQPFRKLFLLLLLQSVMSNQSAAHQLMRLRPSAHVGAVMAYTERSAGSISRPSSGRRRLLLRPLSALRASPARPSSRPPKPSKTREEARCRVDQPFRKHFPLAFFCGASCPTNPPLADS
jgi:hypothetical protein